MPENRVLTFDEEENNSDFDESYSIYFNNHDLLDYGFVSNSITNEDSLLLLNLDESFDENISTEGSFCILEENDYDDPKSRQERIKGLKLLDGEESFDLDEEEINSDPKQNNLIESPENTNHKTAGKNGLSDFIYELLFSDDETSLYD